MHIGRICLDLRRAPTSGIGRTGFNLARALYRLRDRLGIQLTLLLGPETSTIPGRAWSAADRRLTTIRCPSPEDVFELPDLLNDNFELFITPHHYVSPFVQVPTISMIHDLWLLKSSRSVPNHDEVLRQHGYPMISAAHSVVACFEELELARCPRWVKRLYRSRGSLVDRFSMATMLLALFRSRVILTCSKYTRLQLLLLGRDCDEVVEVSPVLPRPNLRSAGLGTTGKRLLIVGKLDPRKNYEFLLDVLTICIREHSTPLSVDIVGEVGYRSYGHELVRKGLQIASKPGDIRFHGQVPESTLRRLYAAADLLIAPSLDEGFGLPAFEAIVYGLPVVAANRGGLRELPRALATLVPLSNPDHFAQAVLDALGSRRPPHATDEVSRTVSVRYSLSHLIPQVEAALLLARG
jgi:glycosyltransferase involved in cell wall biosynthesis